MFQEKYHYCARLDKVLKSSQLLLMYEVLKTLKFKFYNFPQVVNLFKTNAEQKLNKNLYLSFSL